MSYFLLPCTAKKGIPDFKLKSSSIKKIEEKKGGGFCVALRGGRLTAFMIWEMIVTVISVMIFFTMMFLFVDFRKGADLIATVNLLKVVYGLLSFPFIIFAVPILAGVVTSTKATAYDNYGRCIPNIPSLYKK